MPPHNTAKSDDNSVALVGPTRLPARKRAKVRARKPTRKTPAKASRRKPSRRSKRK